jgi:outer membrane cobalamin receptor
MKIIPFSIILLATTAAPAIAAVDAQATGSTIAIAQDDEDMPVDENTSGEIVVTAERIRGSVDTDVPPVEQLNEADIASLGASSLTDLVAAVAPQANSGRGRGGGRRAGLPGLCRGGL